MLIRKVAIPWVNGLCGLLPAIEAFADVYVPETAGLPISRCLGPAAPRSVHKTHSWNPPLKFSSSAQPVEAGPRSVKEPSRSTLRRFADEGAMRSGGHSR